MAKTHKEETYETKTEPIQKARQIQKSPIMTGQAQAHRHQRQVQLQFLTKLLIHQKEAEICCQGQSGEI